MHLLLDNFEGRFFESCKYEFTRDANVGVQLNYITGKLYHEVFSKALAVAYINFAMSLLIKYSNFAKFANNLQW